MSTDNRQQEIKEALVLLGLDERQCDVLLILLQNKSQTAAQIAKQLPNIARTSIYDILKALQKYGFISTIERDSKLHYQVEDIEHAIDVLEEQKRELTEKQNSIRSVADIFHQLKTGTAYQPGTRFFEGKNGILAIHRELQNARAETRTIVDIASVYRVFPRMVYEDNLKDFQTYKVLKKDLMIKSKEAESYLQAAPVTEFHKVKWLPPTAQFKTDTLIWEGHVAIIDYADSPNGIVIDNPTIADTFVAWFEMMWNSVKDGETL